MSQDRKQRLRQLTSRVVDTYQTEGGINRIGEKNLPSQAAVVDILDELLAVIFPGYYGEPVSMNADLDVLVGFRLDHIYRNLADVVESTLKFCGNVDCNCSALWPAGGEIPPKERLMESARQTTLDYLEQLPTIRSLLRKDIQAAFEGDPAATNSDEIILCYPGVLAIAVHRLAHPLHHLGVPLIPRMMSEWAHTRTGVDIHPGARIGANFFIDHGTGVVIGATCVIGENVKIYQSVTLGALSFRRKKDGTMVKGGKRHPTIGNGVTIYANATILGGDTEIGENAVIGGGAWITSSVPAGSIAKP